MAAIVKTLTGDEYASGEQYSTIVRRVRAARGFEGDEKEKEAAGFVEVGTDSGRVNILAADIAAVVEVK